MRFPRMRTLGMLWPPKSDCHWRWVQVWTHCLPPSRGALQPAASRTMRVRATRAFHTTLPDKIIFPFIIVLIVMPPVYLCRRTPFMMMSPLHVTKVMVLIMIMTRDPRSEIRDQRPETRDQRPETRDPRPETRDQRLWTRDQRPETRNQRPETRDQRSEIRDQRPETRY